MSKILFGQVAERNQFPFLGAVQWDGEFLCPGPYIVYILYILYSETLNNGYIERIHQMSYSSLSDNGMLQIFSFLIK